MWGAAVQVGCIVSKKNVAIKGAIGWIRWARTAMQSQSVSARQVLHVSGGVWVLRQLFVAVYNATGFP